MKGGRLVALGLGSIAAAIACGGFGSDSTPEAADAGIEASPADALPAEAEAASPEACTDREPFVHFEPLRAINAPGLLDVRPSLTADELHVYFQRAPDGSLASLIMTASRATRDAEFGTPTELAELHAYSMDNVVASPGVSSDGAHLALATFPVADLGRNFQLAIVDRQLGTSAFGSTPVLATSINDPSHRNQSPTYQGDGQRIFFNSDRHGVDAGSNRHTIFVASPAAGSDGPHDIIDAQTSAPLIGVNPVPSPDATALYFARSDAAGFLHILVGDLSADALTVTNIAPIATPTGATFTGEATYESPGYLSTDHCRLYLSIDTDDPGAADLWVASRR